MSTASERRPERRSRSGAASHRPIPFPRSPATPETWSGNPAAGTRRDSMPAAVPSQATSTPIERSRSATASAG